MIDCAKLAPIFYRKIVFFLVIVPILSAFPTPVPAHDARPLSVTITEPQPHLYLARLRAPASIALDNRPELEWPSGCRVLSAHPSADAGALAESISATCIPGLDGQTLKIRFPIYNPSLATLFRFTTEAKTVTQVLPPDQLAWTVPARAGLVQVARGYLALGVEHIWTGVDHLLFVTGLLILAGTLRRVLLAVTGFTLAHSITLSLSALRLVEIPVPPVEAAIALSILFLAREIARPHPDGLAARYPMLVATSFGLLHGFGFAAALREVGLPTDELAIGLLCFNLGVEAGQLVFIAGLVGIFALVGRLMGSRLATIPGPKALAGYALGIPAAFWFVQRLAAVVI
jgi:hydrogenase/urease accessory protein HupE